jgi:enoyl-CoA hydratase
MTAETVKFQIEDHIAFVTLNRPEVHNAVSAGMMHALESVLEIIEANKELFCIILTGAGKESFCAGGDLKYFTTLKTGEAGKEMSLRMQNILNRLWNGKIPVIAAINGQALGGGCEILTACHLRIAASRATFAFRQTANGIITGWGGGVRIFQQVSTSQAMRLLLMAESINSKEALKIGLVDKIVESSQLMNEAKRVANEICQNSEDAIQKVLELKRMIDQGDINRAIEFETNAFADLWDGNHFRNFIKRHIENK